MIYGENGSRKYNNISEYSHFCKKFTNSIIGIHICE